MTLLYGPVKPVAVHVRRANLHHALPEHSGARAQVHNGGFRSHYRADIPLTRSPVEQLVVVDPDGIHGPTLRRGVRAGYRSLVLGALILAGGCASSAPPLDGSRGRWTVSPRSCVYVQITPLTQRPAESDKTIVSNAAAIHSGFMGFPDDRAYMARCLDVPLRDIERLRPLDWIERDLRTRALTRGRLVFR